MKTEEEIKLRIEYLKGKIDGFNQSKVVNAEYKMCDEACLNQLQWVLESEQE